jgi:hypothetical protein
MVDLHENDSASRLGLLHGGFGVGSLLSPLAITALLAVITWQQISLLMGADVGCRTGFRRDCRRVFPRRPTGQNGTAAFGRNVEGVSAQAQEHPDPAGRLSVRRHAGRADRLAGAVYDASLSSRGARLDCAFHLLGLRDRKPVFAPRIPLRPIKLFLIGILISCAFQIVGVLSGSAAIMCVMVGLIGLVTGMCIPMQVAENAVGQAGNTSLATSALLVTMCFSRILIRSLWAPCPMRSACPPLCSRPRSPARLRACSAG